MKVNDFLVCKFKGDITTYVAEITKVTANNFTCKFSHSGSVYEFEIENWTVSKTGKTFPLGTPLTEYIVYTKSDFQHLPGEGKESFFVCVTFWNNNRYLGILTETTSLLFSRCVTFIHSKANYIFSVDNKIEKSEGFYKVGEKISGIEIYVARTATVTFTDEEGETVEVEKGTLHTDWQEYFKNFTIEEMQDSIKRGNHILNNMVETTVEKAKIISHAITNPVTAKALTEDLLKAGFDAITLNELGFVKNASKAVFKTVFGSFVEIIRAHESWEVAKTRSRLFEAYISGCMQMLYPNDDLKPVEVIEKGFYDLGMETVKNLNIRENLEGDIKVIGTEFMRGDFVAALIERYRLWEHTTTFTIERYIANTKDMVAAYRGFVYALKTSDNLTDD